MASALNHPHILTVHEAGGIRRPPVSGHRVRRWRHAQGVGPARAALAAPDRGAAGRGGRRTGGGARGRDSAPRHQTGKHPGHGEWLREARGLRAGEVGRPCDTRRGGAHDHGGRNAPGRGHRHRRVHVAGAGLRKALGCAQRHFLVWRGALRTGGRTPAVYRRHRSRTPADRHSWRAGAAWRAHPDRAADGGRQGAGEGPGGALPDDARSGGGSAARGAAVGGGAGRLSGRALHPPSRSWRRLAPFALVGAALAALLAYWLVWSGRSTAEIPSQWSFSQLTDQPGQELYPSLSPDGQSLVYASQAAGNWDIYLQRVGGTTALNLTKDSAADDTQPAFSPDGELDRVPIRARRGRIVRHGRNR